MKKFLLFLGVTLFSSPLLFGQAPSLWMTATEGGTMSYGTILKADNTGSNFQTVYSFDSTNGSCPIGNLCIANNGKLYGITTHGGYNDSCVIYSFDTLTGICTNIYDFDFNIQLGYQAQSGLIAGSNGYLYGTTKMGGQNGKGVIYRIDPTTDVYTKIFDFTDSLGEYPLGFLLEFNNGKLYGTTSETGFSIDSIFGDYGNGVIFSFDPQSGIYTKLYDFTGTEGREPHGNLILGDGNKLYGTTYYGGTNDMGVLFSFDLASNTYHDLHNFDSLGGEYPNGKVIRANDGKLYGMTFHGGSSNLGILYSYDIANSTFTKLIDFIGLNGSKPLRGLTQTSNSKLYGTTNFGGINSRGVAFNYDIVLHTFNKLLDLNYAITGSYPDCDILETGAMENNNGIFFQSICESEINLFPSPASNQISISGNSISINGMVTVTDVLGREVLHQKVSQPHQINLNLSSLLSGVYFAKVKIQNGSVVKRFVKE